MQAYSFTSFTKKGSTDVKKYCFCFTHSYCLKYFILIVKAHCFVLVVARNRHLKEQYIKFLINFLIDFCGITKFNICGLASSDINKIHSSSFRPSRALAV